MILALGTGRSGTSDVARILEEQGVMMGHRFHMGDEFNPRGYFEDRDFQELNMMYVMLGLGENPKGDQLKLWLDRFNKLINTRQEPWGLKDPGIADFPELLDHYMKLNPKVILCERNRQDIEDIDSRYLRGMKFTYATKMNEVVRRALLSTTVDTPIDFNNIDV